MRCFFQMYFFLFFIVIEITGELVTRRFVQGCFPGEQPGAEAQALWSIDPADNPLWSFPTQ